MSDLDINKIKQEIMKMDPALSEDDEGFKVATILLAGLCVGPNVKKVAKFTGLGTDFVSEVSRRLRKSGVWKAGKTYADWFDEEAGDMTFWADVCVGQGLLERTN